MANDLTYNPLVIDTAAATTLISYPIFVKSIRWVGATTAGHTVSVQDPDGNVLWSSVAGGSNNIEADLIERIWQDGFAVPTLQSGTLYIGYL